MEPRGWLGFIGSLSVFGFHSKASARALLLEASHLYKGGKFEYALAGKPWRNDFSQGARWMQKAMGTLRARERAFPEGTDFNLYGLLKNGSAASVAGLVLALGSWRHWWLLILC